LGIIEAESETEGWKRIMWRQPPRLYGLGEARPPGLRSIPK